jgi:hypothetical protein
LTNSISWFIPYAMNANEISPKANSHLKLIQITSDILKIFFLVIAVVVFYALAMMIGGIVMEKHYAATYYSHNKLETGCDLVRQIARVILICFCYKLFELCSRGELFTSKIVRCIRFIGYAYFLIALTVFPKALLVIRVDSETIVPRFISSLFVSFLFLFIAWILNASLKIKEEHE